MLVLCYKTLVCYSQPRLATIEKSMNTRSDKIKQLKQKMNVVEDEVFASFCEEIGVSNIR